MKDLFSISEEMCKTLTDELEECNEKVHSTRGKITAGDIDYIDKLTHAIKSLKTTMAMLENWDEYSGSDGRNYGYSNGNYSGYHYPHMNRSNTSMARGYSRSKDDMIAEFHRLMNEAPDEATRLKIQRLIDDMK